GGSSWWAFLLGVLFALAFCPSSGVFYFLMLIPMTVASPDGLILPPVYAIATGLPVIIIAWLLAFSMSGVGTFYNKVKMFEKWFRLVAAVLFILAGLYFVYIFYIQI
ncbi:MAG TPA: sulfite exporter TauE/SafE family protein, partial [Bacteroidales bacterium]|nr:sulfite exporter TauE/SafE family protein [Bacteroidales bacterium]